MKTFFTGVNDSFTLLAFRFSSSKTIMKIGALLFLGGAFLSILTSLFTTSFIRSIMTAQLPDDPTAETARELQRFLDIYLQIYTSGQMDGLISGAVALLLGSIIFVPFSGYVIHGMVSHSEMVIVKSGDTYKIGDSILFQIISSFTLIQLIGLTVAAQLMTFDSPRPAYAVLFVWSVWLFMTLLTTAFSWVVEYVSRKFGSLTRAAFLGIFVMTLALILLLDPKHGTTLFGTAPIIFNFLTELATGDTTLLLTALAVIAVMCIIAIYLLTAMATHTLRMPEPLTLSKTNEKQIKGTSIPLKPIALITRLLFRYNTVTKPVLTSVAFSLLIVLLLKGENALTTTMIVLPLAVGVSFGANIFGLMSGAVNWLLSINGWRRKMINSGTAIIFVAVALCYLIVYGVGLIFGSVTWAQVYNILPAIIAVTFVTTILSVHLSVARPLPFSGKARENLISSPTALIAYVFLFLMGPGTVGNITLLANEYWSWIIAGGTVIIVSLQYFSIYRKWMYTEEYTKRILKETINAG